MKIKTVQGNYEFDIDVATVNRMISAYLMFAPDRIRDITVIEAAVDLKRDLAKAVEIDARISDVTSIDDDIKKLLKEGVVSFDEDDGEIPSDQP